MSYWCMHCFLNSSIMFRKMIDSCGSHVVVFLLSHGQSMHIAHMRAGGWSLYAYTWKNRCTLILKVTDSIIFHTLLFSFWQFKRSGRWCLGLQQPFRLINRFQFLLLLLRQTAPSSSFNASFLKVCSPMMVFWSRKKLGISSILRLFSNKMLREKLVSNHVSIVNIAKTKWPFNIWWSIFVVK